MVRRLPPNVKKKYLPLSQIRWPNALDDRPASSSQLNGRQRIHPIELPLSPTVSDYERSSIAEPSRDTFHVPSSVSPPTSPRAGSKGPRERPQLSPSPTRPARSHLSTRRPAPSTSQRIREPSPETDSIQAAFDLAAAIQSANSGPFSGIHSDVIPESSKPRKPLVRPGKRKPTSPPPVAGPSRPHKKQQTQHPSRPAPAPPQNHDIEATSSSTSYLDNSPSDEVTFVTYGLGDDFIGQCLTVHSADIDVSEPPIEERFPDPKELQKLLVSACRHLLTSVDIDPAAVLSGSWMPKPLPNLKAPEAPQLAEDDDDYMSPPRVWDDIQAARAKNALAASPTRPKRAKRKRAPSGPHHEHLVAGPPQQKRLPTVEIQHSE